MPEHSDLKAQSRKMPAQTRKLDGAVGIHLNLRFGPPWVRRSAKGADTIRNAFRRSDKAPYPRPAANTRATFSNGRAMKNDRMIACS